MWLPEQIYPAFERKDISNAELKGFLEVPRLKKLTEEAISGGLTKRLSYSCLIVTVIVKVILEKEKYAESKEFFKAVYECSEEVAKAAKEGWFGLGDAISSKISYKSGSINTEDSFLECFLTVNLYLPLSSPEFNTRYIRPVLYLDFVKKGRV